MKNLSRMQRYFVKQKLIGLLLIIFGMVLTLSFTDGAPFMIPVVLGLWMLFTKKMVWIDDYYDEIEDRKRKRRRS